MLVHGSQVLGKFECFSAGATATAHGSSQFLFLLKPMNSLCTCKTKHNLISTLSAELCLIA